MITEELLRSWVNIERHEQLVRDKLVEVAKSPEALLRFFRKYAKWNSYFAAGVAQLVANIARSGELFMEPGLPRALADRSQFIASFFFDAARDEFDDHINRERDPHRSMAQAMLQALAHKDNLLSVLDEEESTLFVESCEQVVTHYDGVVNARLPRTHFQTIFIGIGYHLGSELLADREFSLIDQFLREKFPSTVDYLKRQVEVVSGVEHRAYAWVGVHSGMGGGAEADHFAWAIEGTNKAVEFSGTLDREEIKQSIMKGFSSFAADHNNFFWPDEA